MVGININSGKMQFEDAGQTPGKTPNQTLNVLVVGDFSGRESRAVVDAAGLEKRKLHRIDKDSFDDVFARLGVSVALPVSEQPVAFTEIEQLHPDYLFHNLELFARYRQILRQLSSPSHYQEAVAALTEQGIVAQKTDPSPVADSQATAPGLLDQMLTSESQSQAFDVAALIRKTVAPYVEPKADPNAEHYLAAVEAALTATMRELMQASPFKSIEASWRALEQLNRRVDSDRDVHIHLLDCSKSELLADYVAGGQQAANATLGQRLLQQQGVRGATAIDCLLLDMDFAADADDIAVLNYMGELALALNARLIAGANAQLLGQQQFTGLMEPAPATAPIFSAPWQQLRQQQFAEDVFLTMPRFLLRLPYGQRSKPIESFAFEELSQPGHEREYLWGNGGYLMVIGWLQTRQRARHRGKTDGTWAYIEHMPIHVYHDSDGDECVMPSTAVYLSTERVAALEQEGLTALQSVKNSDQVFISRWVSLAKV